MAGVKNRMGKTVVLDINDILLVLTENRHQVFDLQFYRSLGIEPAEKQILCVFSSVHYRAVHAPVAKKIIEVDTPGIASPRLAGYPWKSLKRPVFPLDAETFDLVEWKTIQED
jgi:microcystin degradation protein MlrC